MRLSEEIVVRAAVGTGFAIRLFAGLSALGGACADAAAADALFSPEPAAGWIVTLGGVAQLSPRFDGSSELRPYGIPSSIGFRRAGTPAEFSAKDDGLEATLWSGPAGFRIGPVASYRPGRFSSGNQRLAGLNDVPWSLELGGFAEVWPLAGQLRARIELKRGFHGTESQIGAIGADWVDRRGRFTLSGGPRLEFADRDFMQKQYGVTAAEALRNGRVAAYAPRAGLRALGVITSLDYEWSPAWTTGLFSRYDRLVVQAANSPIVRNLGSRDQFTFGVNFSYSFGVGN